MKKIDTKKIIEAMKKVANEKPKSLFNPVMKPTHRERDMRQEAMDMGAHQAKEFFGEQRD